MCFNKEVSLVVFFFGLIASIKLFLISQEKTDEKEKIRYQAAGIFIFFVNLMQLNEFFLWLYKNPTSPQHQFFSKLIMVTIFLQFLSFYPSSYKLSPSNDFFYSLTSFYTMGLITFVVLIIKSQFLDNLKSIPSPECKPKGISCRMNWDVVIQLKKNFFLLNINWLFYFLIAFMCVYLIFDITGIVLLGVIFLLSLIYSLYTGAYTTTTAASSLWCFITVLVASIMLLVGDNILDNDKRLLESDKDKNFKINF